MTVRRILAWLKTPEGKSLLIILAAVYGLATLFITVVVNLPRFI